MKEFKGKRVLQIDSSFTDLLVTSTKQAICSWLNPCQKYSGRSVWFSVLLTAGILAGCEAPLVLDNVEKQRAKPIQRTDRYQAAAFNGSATAVVGNQGVIVYSADKGETWQRHTLDGWPALIDIAACPNGNFAVLAYNRTVYLSADNGETWQAKPITTEETPQAITCTANNHLWVVGSFTFMWSSKDLGDTWTESTRDQDSIFTSVQFIDDNIGFVTGEFGIFLKTTDGGASWESMAPLPNEFYSQAAHFRSETEGWVTGLGGKILFTNDGGRNWTEQVTNVPVPIYGITEINGEVYVAGGEGTLLQLVGNEWKPVAHDKPLRLYIRALAGVDDELLVGGINGTLHLIQLNGA